MTVPPALVVDASVAAKWFLIEETHTESARFLLDAFDAGRTRLSAPALIRYEVAQTLERAVRLARIGDDEAFRELRAFLSKPFFAAADSSDLVLAAQILARATGASVYDALYVAHAEEIGFDVVTADEQLARQMAEHPVTVHLLSDLDLP